jgi:uncharacterized cupredoxin-like copper-binding protein
MKKTAILCVALTTLIVAAPARSHEGHSHESYSAGQPGDPKKPSRTTEVDMSEMDFTPSRIDVTRGEQIRFVIRNVGTEDHEFLLSTAWGE